MNGPLDVPLKESVRQVLRGLLDDKLLTPRTADLNKQSITAAAEGRLITPTAVHTVRCALARAQGQMACAPTIDQANALAAAVVMQGVADLRDVDPSVRADARHFIRVSLWTNETPWAAVLNLSREAFLKALDDELTRSERDQRPGRRRGQKQLYAVTDALTPTEQI